jgi:arsenite methyltransferase
MRRVLAAWTEHSAHPYWPRTLAPQLRNAGFQVTHQVVFSLFNPYYDTDTYSHGVIDFIATFVQGRHGITPDEAQAWADELRQRGREDGYFFSLNRYAFLTIKPEAERGI